MLPVKSSLLPTVSRFIDDDWNSLFDWANRNHSTPVSTLPSVNIKETGDEFVVEMAAPGMKKNDFQIELNNNLLIIKCELKNESEEKEADRYTRKEFNYRSFVRSFNLNNRIIDESKIKATYLDGILNLRLPKKEEAKEKPLKLIKVS